MTNWLDEYRDSVSWGDEIVYSLTYTRDGQLRPIECCFFPANDTYVYVVPGKLSDLNQALTDAAVVKANSNCLTNVLFTDDTATEAQVEEAMTVLGQKGFGCRFLKAQPDVLHLGLLDRMSEGTLLERAIEIIQDNTENSQ